MNTASMLTKGIAESLLKVACENLERDGFLIPVLMLNINEKGRLMHMLKALPNTPEQKQAYFAKIGAHYGYLGQLIREAVLLMESWMVQVQQAPAALRLRPSQHPCRQEVLMLIGRDAANSRSTQVIQPFTRDTTNKLVWSKPLMAIYDEPVKQGHSVQGLLDDLFLANQRFGP
jgi:hypothetical protein